MTTDNITVLSFLISVIGTLSGLISLSISIYVWRNTSKIKKNLMRKHLQSKYKISKRSIAIKMLTSYELLKEDDVLDEIEIQECIISLLNYNDILSRSTKRKLKSLRKEIKSYPLYKSADKIREIRILLYEVMRNLEDEVDEYDEYFKEVTK